MQSYRGQTTIELLALEDEFLILGLLYQAIDQHVYREKRDYSEAEVVIPSVFELDLEVKNGGYYQFLTNSSGRYAGLVVQALEKLRCPKTLEITRDALAALPADWRQRDRKEIVDLLDPFDQLYYQTGEDVQSEIVEFVRQNPQLIRLP